MMPGSASKADSGFATGFAEVVGACEVLGALDVAGGLEVVGAADEVGAALVVGVGVAWLPLDEHAARAVQASTTLTAP